MAEKKKSHGDYNENWEAEIAAYDEEIRQNEEEFRCRYLVMEGDGYESLTDEENELIALYLKGSSLGEIAEQYNVEVDIVEGYIEIIKAKLSLE